MISGVHHDNPAPTWRRPGESDRQFVGLAPRVGEIAHLERFGEGCRKASGVLDEALVEIPGVGVEYCHLFPDGADYLRVRVPDMRHVVDRVEEPEPIVVVEVLLPAANDGERSSVGDAQRRADLIPATRRDLI